MKTNLSILFTLLTTLLFSQQPDTTALGTPVSLNEVVLEARVIFGSKFAARNRTGSSYYISPEEIE
ncbi:hypothetical protein, partial [Robiginitalea sp.]|uniref:hypothetical protein n=1 Tax=Robiginitalea sp. TaxID=1902411 RepID=UPI003C39A2EB